MGFGLGIRNRIVHAWRRAARERRQSARRPGRRIVVRKLHIGSGPVVIPGWTNVDLEALPGVDHVLDVRDGLPFEGVEYIYAEHFIEHLTHDEGMRFLRECRAALSDVGVLRLSTPNLEWVLATQYHRPSPDAIGECFAVNKSFRGWGHQFLYNLETLSAALTDAGFAEVRACRYGESEREELRNLERHEPAVDTDELPHVIIVEASGRGAATSRLAAASEDYDWAIHA